MNTDITDTIPDDVIKVAVDMQKVIMLPRIPGVKTVIFTKRIIVFHMTYAPLGSGKLKKPYGLIWHEAFSGQRDENVTNTYIKFITNCERDKNILYFGLTIVQPKINAGPCLCQVVSDPHTVCEKITIKYFEPGHTFMAADSFHHEIEARVFQDGNLK